MSSVNLAHVDHDEDITQNIMETLSAALLINPKFNFGKFMELSEEINGTKNKELLSDIITLSFLKYLDMDDAAGILSSQNLIADSAYKTMHLDNEDTMKWFVRFIAVMNPSLLASISVSLSKVVNGIMIKNTRSADADRLERTNAKLNKLVSSGDLVKKIEENNEKKPVEERKRVRDSANVGLLGWMSGTKTVGKSKDNKTSYVKSKSSSPESKKSKSSTNRRASRSTASDISNNKLSKVMSEIKLEDDELMPEESASNVGSNKTDIKDKKLKSKTLTLSAVKKKVEFDKEESIVSG